MSSLTTKEIIKHIVDLRRSDWDKERSNRKKGHYFWNGDSKTSKVYVKDSDYRDDAIRPPYVFFFVGYDEQDPQSGFGYWNMHYGAEAVTESDDYWPEPLKPDSNGHYKFIDSILVKVPVENWVDKVEGDRDKYDRSAENLHKSFNEQARAAGCAMKD
jgi:hypothetical protein